MKENLIEICLDCAFMIDRINSNTNDGVWNIYLRVTNKIIDNKLIKTR